MPADLLSPYLPNPDPIYGYIALDEPVLEALLRTEAVQRLSGVLQHGITGLIGVTNRTTRLEHSLGAMWLVRRLGAGLPEQIAALLHDVSHTAMSHVIDYVYAQPNEQAYHEDKKAWYLAQSDIPPVLAQHGFDWRDFVEEEAYTLLEQPAPALCADRIDYFLRDGATLGLLTSSEIEFILAHLVVYQDRIVTDSVEAGRLMAYRYMAADEASWSSFREVCLYELTARALRTALELEIISEADLWSVDQRLWARLHQAKEPALQAWLEWISPATEFMWDETSPTFWVSSKIRTIDPDVLIDHTLRPLSEIDPTFAQEREDYIARKQGQWPMRVVGL